MVPLSTLVSITPQSGTEVTNRFNLFRSVEINGVPGPGFTSGQAIQALEEVFAQTMPKEMGFAYAQLSYQEKVAPPAGPTFVLAIVFVFLLLAAMYESWRLPWAVLLGSPLVALVDSALAAARLRLRPILMTAFAFILGVTPLLTAAGAGAEARKVMGMAVFSGMLIATILGVCLIPMLYVAVEKVIGGAKHAPAAGASPTQTLATEHGHGSH